MVGKRKSYKLNKHGGDDPTAHVPEWMYHATAQSPFPAKVLAQMCVTTIFSRRSQEAECMWSSVLGPVTTEEKHGLTGGISVLS